jgi:hypothetical protein
MGETVLTFCFSLLMVNSSSTWIPGVDPELLRGDANNDSLVNMADSVSIQTYLYQGGYDPPCMDAADVNDDGLVNNTDNIFLLNYLFMGGPHPASPFPACGADSTPDSLDCLNTNC